MKLTGKGNTMRYVIAILLAIALMAGCSSEKVNQPSKCDTGSPEIAKLMAWSFSEYGIEVKSEKMILCEIARDKGYHLEATGDLIMALDLVAIRANAYKKEQAIKVFTTMRDTFLGAAKGAVIISTGDLADIAEQYAADYPELQIALRYTSVLKYPQYAEKIPGQLDFMDLVQWCDRNIDAISRVKI